MPGSPTTAPQTPYERVPAGHVVTLNDAVYVKFGRSLYHLDSADCKYPGPAALVVDIGPVPRAKLGFWQRTRRAYELRILRLLAVQDPYHEVGQWNSVYLWDDVRQHVGGSARRFAAALESLTERQLIYTEPSRYRGGTTVHSLTNTGIYEAFRLGFVHH